VFTGNPGTGKTTVARILAQIYKALGILERGHLIECDRQSLVGGYVGQTAIKTAEIIERAMGGVLFIDEAYSLTEGGQSDFGKEAIEIILKRMEDRRGDFIVIAAGYTDNMKRFIESNPGLKSRFDRTFHFEDFKTPELVEIAVNQFSESNLKTKR
jgi:SpoVK/Ycf46/Vps4 family AAA+-type ATPase